MAGQSQSDAMLPLTLRFITFSGLRRRDNFVRTGNGPTGSKRTRDETAAFAGSSRRAGDRWIENGLTSMLE
jgi:hypothetical protein